MYKEIFSFSELNIYKDKIKSGRTIFFFDVQGVIIRNNNFHEALNYKKYEEKLKNLCIQKNENYIKIAKYGRFFKSKLTEDFLLLFLNDLRSCGVELCLLTFARYSVDRERALKNLKVLDCFDREIWTGGIDKGLLLIEYVKMRSAQEPLEQVFFVDDKEEHLNSAKKAIDEYIQCNKNTTLEYELFAYKKYPVTTVNEFDFLKFWEIVIQTYKKNKIIRSQLMPQRTEEKKTSIVTKQYKNKFFPKNNMLNKKKPQSEKK